jgi:hypothetical protein
MQKTIVGSERRRARAATVPAIVPHGAVMTRLQTLSDSHTGDTSKNPEQKAGAKSWSKKLATRTDLTAEATRGIGASLATLPMSGSARTPTRNA